MTMAEAKPRSRRTRKARTPLLDGETSARLNKRLIEALGVVLLLLAALSFLMLWTYNWRDPSFFSATDADPTNALGLVGSYLADPLHRALGWAAYGLPLGLAVWGVRMILKRGHKRAITRMVLIPIAIAVGAVFASGHVPLDSWIHPYGLGGQFGDDLILAVTSVIPMPLGYGIKVATLLVAIPFLAIGLTAAGVDWTEFKAMLRGIWRGLGVSSRAAMALTGKGVRKAAMGARAAREKKGRDDGGLVRREPTLQAGEAPVGDDDGYRAPKSILPDEDRVMARIAAAVRRKEQPVIEADEPVIADDPTAAIDDRHEPPLEAASPRRPEPPQPRVQQPERKPVAKSSRAKAEEQPSLALGDGSESDYEVPPLSLLQNPSTIVRRTLSNDALEQNARMLETVLDDYGVKGEIVSVRPGPVVTMYELEPAAGLKASRVIGLADDIARSMSALAARVSTIPGRTVIGIELPNEHREMVLLREILAGKSFGDGTHSLPMALGKDIAGDPVVANLSRMPHLLIAGTTGSGKSVAINTMILSLLYKLTPDQCRLIMIDPKMLELSVYDGIPHLLSPVVTDPKKAVVALKWVVAEMEERYRKMSKMGVRNIDGYNQRVDEALRKGEGFTRTVQTGFDDETGEPVFETEEYAPEKMPFIVVIVDEMADLMMVAGKEIEACIQRLAQMARASGIHLIMATQRPSVDVITGTIKANFPTRISFQVTSKVDSRTILGEMGAEQLLGQGDMLYMAGGGRITRVHGPFVSDTEVEEVVTFLKQQGAPDYVSGVVEGPDDERESEIDQVLGLGGNTTGEDALYDQAVGIVAKDRKCSTSYIQRKLGIGYNKAARLVEQMEDEGVVSQANHVGKREILIPER